MKVGKIVKISAKDIEQKAEETLKECLGNIPFIKILSVQKGLNFNQIVADLFVQIEVGTQEKCLIIEAKSNGQPRYARAAVNQLLRFRDLNPQCYCIFVAPYISSRAAKICIEAGMGYMDLAGNCYLNFEQVYIEKTGQPNPFIEKKELRSLYSPKASRVLRVLIENPQQKWKVEEIASKADVSLGQVSNVKKLLADLEWIDETYGGFELKEPAQLLENWVEAYTYKKNKIFRYYSMDSVADMEWELSEACKSAGVEYALTSFSGAARLKPFVKYQRVFAFVQGDIPEVALALNLKEVTSGENVILLEPYDDGVFYEAKEIDGISVASAIQLYLDLKGFRGRGDEAAETIYEEFIKNRW